MGALRTLAAAAAALALAPAALASPPVSARLTLTPPRAGVGEPVAAEAVVTVDRSQVDPAKLAVAFGVSPLTALGPVATTTAAHGRTTELRYRVTAACLDADCAPGDAATTVELAPVRITGVATDGTAFASVARWPALTVVPRVPARKLRGVPPLRAETAPPPVRYDVSPGWVSAGLDLLAAVLVACVAAGAALLVRAERRRRRRERGLDELERALALVRGAAARDADDRRRAVNLLARTVRRRAPALASTGERLAWAPSPPSPEAAGRFADEVEREVRP